MILPVLAVCVLAVALVTFPAEVVQAICAVAFFMLLAFGPRRRA